MNIFIYRKDDGIPNIFLVDEEKVMQTQVSGKNKEVAAFMVSFAMKALVNNIRFGGK